MFLIVTAYYNIPSKKPYSFYLEHIQLFFKYIKTLVLFFTDSQNYNVFKNLAGPNVTFKIQEFETLDIFNNFSIDFWKHEITKDPENSYHTWQLGSLWANKSRFVKVASSLFKQYEWYMWVDCGCIRNDSWLPIIDGFGSRTLPSIKGVYVQLLNPIPDKNFFIYPNIHVAGSHILFHKDYIDTYITAYSDMLKEYNKNNIPLISDQYIITSMIKRNYTFLHYILYNPIYHNVPDKWFFFFMRF